MSRRSMTGGEWLLPLVAVLVLWQAAAWLSPVAILPGPLETLCALAGLASQADFYRQLTTTAWRGVVGFGVAMALGIGLGLWMGRRERAYRFFHPLLLLATSVPVLLVRAGEREAKDSRRPTLCRRILVPLDGSELAEQVLPVVSAIARVLEAEITLFQVVTTHVLGSFSGEWYPSSQSTFEMVEQQAKVYLERMADHLNEQGIETSTAVRTGPVAESIVKYADTSQTDLIAMCTHGRTGLARWALGSVADRVLRAAGIPILLVRAG